MNLNAANHTTSLHLPKRSRDAKGHHGLHDRCLDTADLHHDLRACSSIKADIRICVSPVHQTRITDADYNSRDNGLPFSDWIRRVSPRYKIPVNSVLLSVPFTAALSLINLGTRVAFNAVLSLATIGLMATYVLSISCIMLRRIRKQALPRARWSLGKAGLPVNCIGLAYASWSCFWSFWPVENGVTAATFNWGGVLFFGLMALSWILYQSGAKKNYHGPVTKVQHWMNGW